MIKVSKFLIVLFTCVMFTTFGVKTFQRSKDWFDEEQVNNSIGNGSVLGAIVDVLQENSGKHYIFTV